MALKRLDEEFELKPGTQLLPYMKRLLPSLEGRFQTIETQQDIVQQLTEEIRAAALMRMNEILIPATENIIAVTRLGFLLGPSSTLVELKLGPTFFVLDEGPQRTSFTPSPYVICEREANIDDYAIARVDSYNQENGELVVTITAWHGDPGPHSDWVISSTPGMADSTKLYHDAVGPMRDQVAADKIEVAAMRDDVLASQEALEGAGLDAENFIRRDGIVAFTALQPGITAAPGANDTMLATTAWARARMIEYSNQRVNKGGDTMSGPLILTAAITQRSHAVNKAYVDDLLLGPMAQGILNTALTIAMVNPTMILQTTGTLQSRAIEAVSSSVVRRWVLVMADASVESGNNAGSDFRLVRYSDTGVLIDAPLTVSRATGAVSIKALNFTGPVTGTGDLNVVGDLSLYRSAQPTMSTIYMNQAKTAYHSFNGTEHVLAGGGLSTGHINCLSISTQGNPVTVSGLTSNGTVTVNGSHIVNGALNVSSANPTINMADTNEGTMFIHCNQQLIGFLNHQQSWIQYTNVYGQIWSSQYGWMHDYINNRASAYAWEAANYRYNYSSVSHNRLVHVGDVELMWYNMAGMTEPAHGSVVSGFSFDYYYYTGITALRYRQVQFATGNGAWYVAWYA